jgi:hypothetical protein
MAIFCLYIMQAKAQSVLFKIKYLPNHSYESTIAMNMNMEMNFDGDKETMDKIKASGLTLPLVMASNSSMTLQMNTGEVNTQGSFPIIIKYTDVKGKRTMAGKEMAQPENPVLGKTIYASSNSDGHIHIDSIPGKMLNEDFKATLTKTLNNLASQLHFPDKPMNIGDTFTQEVPFSVPVAGVNMQFAIKIIYKLVSMDNNTASFDLDQTMSLDMNTKIESKSVVGHGSGKGDGKMTYDISKSFATNYTSNFSFDFKMQIENMIMTGKATLTSSHTTKIADAAKQ